MPFDDLGDVTDENGMPWYWVITTLLMSSSFWSTISSVRDALAGSSGSMPLPSRPIPRTLCDWLPRREDVAADVGVRLRDRVLDLLERDAVMTQLPGVDQHLVLLDGAAEAGHVDHAGHGLELAFEHPVLDRLELVERVPRAFQHVADDLAGGAPGRQRGSHTLREIGDRARSD